MNEIICMQHKVEESLTKTLDNLFLMNDWENHSSIELLVETISKNPLCVDKFSSYRGNTTAMHCVDKRVIF